MFGTPCACACLYVSGGLWSLDKEGTLPGQERDPERPSGEPSAGSCWPLRRTERINCLKESYVLPTPLPWYLVEQVYEADIEASRSSI